MTILQFPGNTKKSNTSVFIPFLFFFFLVTDKNRKNQPVIRIILKVGGGGEGRGRFLSANTARATPTPR